MAPPDPGAGRWFLSSMVCESAKIHHHFVARCCMEGMAPSNCRLCPRVPLERRAMPWRTVRTNLVSFPVMTGGLAIRLVLRWHCGAVLTMAKAASACRTEMAVDDSVQGCAEKTNRGVATLQSLPMAPTAIWLLKRDHPPSHSTFFLFLPQPSSQYSKHLSAFARLTSVVHSFKTNYPHSFNPHPQTHTPSSLSE